MQFTWPDQSRIRLLAILGLVIATVLLLFLPYRPPRKALEATMYVLGFLLIANYPPVKRIFSAVPKTQRRLVLCLGLVLVVTQIRDRSLQTFPFVAWNMYSSKFSDPSPYLEYVAVCEDGREKAISVNDLFASQRRTGYWRMHGLFTEMENAKNASLRAKAAGLFDTMLMAIISRYVALHPETILTKFRVMQCNLARPVPGHPLKITRQFFQEYPLPQKK